MHTCLNLSLLKRFTVIKERGYAVQNKIFGTQSGIKIIKKANNCCATSAPKTNESVNPLTDMRRCCFLHEE